MSATKVLGAFGLVLLSAVGVAQDESGGAPIEERLMALEALVGKVGDESIERFLDAHVSVEWIESAGRDEVHQLFVSLRDRCHNYGGILFEPTGDQGLRIIFETDRGRWQVDVELDSEPPHRIASVSVEEAPERERLEPFSYGDCVRRLDEYEAAGFAGAVLLVRGGEVLVRRGYGLADPELGVKNEIDTIFAIGSVPIDFTKVAILLLAERGELDTTERLSKYLPGVPSDKEAITLDHLMSGRSGLRNFHGIRGVDEDMDLSWIDRDEALRRIFSLPLLFEPGTQAEHSHSAWGVLAAVVEVVSGQSYGEFCREHLFEPAGMERTGLYPHTSNFDSAEVAVGHGARPFGRKSTPQNWGPTSWLVMGSGGMVSTVVDLERWLKAMRAGRLLSPASQRRFWTGGVLAGDNDRGFLCTYNEGPDDLAIVCTNSFNPEDQLSGDVAEALVTLAMTGGPPPFAFDLTIAIDGPEVVVRKVVPGGVAEASGLREGDRIVGVDGDLPSTFEHRLRAAGESGQALRLEVERVEGTVEVELKPRRRE